MKKFSILIAAVAMMAMTACNEKPAKNSGNAAGEAASVERADTAAPAGNVKVSVERAKPTDDGKDHVVAEFAESTYQVKLENLADGTYRISLWKAGQDKNGKPEVVAETKNCLYDSKSYMMETADGKRYLVNTTKGAEQLVIMDGDNIIYPKVNM